MILSRLENSYDKKRNEIYSCAGYQKCSGNFAHLKENSAYLKELRIT
jgi:hypothetical protein